MIDHSPERLVNLRIDRNIELDDEQARRRVALLEIVQRRDAPSCGDDTFTDSRTASAKAFPNPLDEPVTNYLSR